MTSGKIRLDREGLVDIIMLLDTGTSKVSGDRLAHRNYYKE